MILCARSSVSAVARDRGSGMYPLGLGPWGSEGPGWKCLDGKGSLRTGSLLEANAGESRSREEVHGAQRGGQLAFWEVARESQPWRPLLVTIRKLCRGQGGCFLC